MKNFTKQLIKIFCTGFFLILILFPQQVLADACSDAHSGWSCQDPAARDGLSGGPCDAAISCPTSGHKCCPAVATQRDARTAFEEGRTKEAAGDTAGACGAFRRAQTLLPNPTTESAITRVCAAAATSPAGAPSTIKLENPLGGGTGVTSIPRLIGNIIKTILTIVGALALAMFVYGGFTWMTSGGSSEKIQKGKNILMWAVIGLVVIFTSYTLVDFLLTALGL